MKTSICTALTGLALGLIGHAAAGEPEKSDPSLPRGLEVRLVAKQTTYTNIQDPKALPKEGKDQLKQSDYPPAPSVDLTLEIRNVSERELHLMVGGREHTLHLELNGPGAFVPKNMSFIDTADRAPGSVVRVAPGKSYTVPIQRLYNGQRATDKGYREFVPVFWTAPGEYTLTASFHTQIGFRDDKEEALKLQPVTLSARAIKLTVKAPEKK
jgi:hypothetical protein